MNRDKTYRRMVGSARWAALAVRVKTEANWQCSKCGRVTTRLAVHHVIPLESAHSENEMEKLCFDESNLQVLCYQCHSDIHKAEKYNSKVQLKKRAAQSLERFMEKYIGTNKKGGCDEKGE